MTIKTTISNGDSGLDVRETINKNLSDVRDIQGTLSTITDEVNTATQTADNAASAANTAATTANTAAAAADELVAEVFGPQPANTALMGGTPINTTGRGARNATFRPVTLTDLQAITTTSSAKRHIGSILRDNGIAVDSALINGAYLDGFNACYTLLKAGVSTILFPNTYYWNSIIPSSVLSNKRLVSKRGGPQSPATVYCTSNTRAMWSLGSTISNLTFEGTHIWEYLDKPSDTTLYAFVLSGINYFFADTLVIRNCTRGMYIGYGSNNVYINHLHVEGDQALVVTAAAGKVRIGRITGTGTVTIATGVDCVIGADTGTFLNKFSSLTATPNKLLGFDSSGNGTLIDWIMGGSWTPTISCDTPGDLSIAYSAANGSVNKRGTQVEIAATLAFVPTYTTATGSVIIGGFPYVGEATTTGSIINLSTTTAFTWPSSATQINLVVQSNLASARLNGYKSGSSSAAGQMSMFASGSSCTLRFHGIYTSAT